MVRIGGERPPDGGGDAARERVGIKRRMTRHREDVSGVGIDRDQRSGTIADPLFGDALEVEVERQNNAVARSFGNLTEQAQAPADRIDFDLLAAAVAVQVLLEGPFEPELADLVAGPVIRQSIQIAHGDFTDIAEQMGRDWAVDIVTARINLQADSGKFELMRLEHHDLMPVEALIDRHRLELRAALIGRLVEFLLEAVLG